MANYIDVLLVRAPDSTPVVVTAPIQKAREGDLVYYCHGQCGTVQQSEWFDTDCEAFQILSAATKLYEAEKVYRKMWCTEDRINAD